MIKALGFSIFAAAFGATGAAHATTVNFDGAVDTLHFASYETDGFTFTDQGIGASFIYDVGGTYNFSGHVLELDGSVVNITHEDGLFDLNSFLYSSSGGGAVTITGIFADTSTIAQTLSGVDAFSGITQTVNFSGFTGLSSVTFSTVGVSFGLFDDIVFNATNTPAVPLPASLPLVLAGLAGLGIAGRKKRAL